VTGNGGCGQFVTHCLCHSFLLRGRTPHTLTCSSMGSLSQKTVVHELLQHGSFLWAAVLHKLLKCGSLPRGAVLQEQTAPAWAPTGSQVLPRNLLRHGLLSPWVHRSHQEPAPAQASYKVTASFRHPPALGGSALANGGSLLEPAGTGSISSHPCSPLLPKSCHTSQIKPVHGITCP